MSDAPSDQNLPPGCTVGDVNASAGDRGPICPHCQEPMPRGFCPDCSREQNTD